MGNYSQPKENINTFVAGFDSECHTCTGWIDEGEEAGYLPGDIYASCGECLQDYREGRTLDE